MKRQLKFRGWDTKESKWLFGYEYENLRGFSLIGETVLFGELSSIPLEDWDHIEIMQFTGLNDKNGNGVYEGDIVSYLTLWIDGYGNKDPKPRKRLIEFSEYSFGYNFDFMDKNSIEVVGNIYENKNLFRNE